MQLTINAKGEITNKPYGVSRWANPRIRECAHKECTKEAVILARAGDCTNKAHNCCTQHERSGA